jgi:hypothetical protein
MGLALVNYADTNGALPPAAVRGKDGRPLLSWRVALLPFIEQEPLYKEFHLDEPWDSPHNLTLLERMPKVYAPFSGKKTPQPFTTYYQVFVGKGTAFESPEGVALSDFPNGTSHTILVTEAGEAVPWTKPEDLAYDPDGSLPPLGGVFETSLRVVFADGTVRNFTREAVAQDEFRSLITRDGGERRNGDLK